ncbi:glycosyltransferase family 2 protein [Microbacterium awajiense]|uniref:Glycosyltransferase family 2 protein n=1 Tax=Microbacterium awajiense TaxID=415214 RepID=A0ABP7AMD4_9MICO
MAETVPLSVCIVTYERRDFLRRCLQALDAAVTDDVEIVVVDASAADAADLVRQVRPSAVYVHDRLVAGWMTRARNAALRHARGEIISFLDDDVVVSPGWQHAVLDAFADPAVVAVAGRTRNGQPGEETYDLPVGRLLPDGSLTEGFASVTASIVDIDHGIGANMSFRRALLARLGGFRDDYPGTAMREDTDIYLRVRRLGGKAVFSPDAVVDHLPAPHVKGRRFDTRYKLYARRNHMVLLARDGGIRSESLRRWIAREYAAVGDAPGLFRKVRRWGVTTAGIAWGSTAMLRQARWSPLPPERTDAAGNEIRAALS